MLFWIAIAVGIILLAAILYWQLIIAEGAYLGAPLVALLYDWTAERYNDIKQFDEPGEDFTIGRPLANRLYYNPDVLLLDVGAGTGRVAQSLLRQPSFEGPIVMLDYSRKMLNVAQRDLAAHGERITYIQADAMALPFADESVPAVTCLEMMEFLPSPEQGLAELVRVLKPTTDACESCGWLVTTNRVGWEASLMPGKAWSKEKLVEELAQYPLRWTEIQIWQDIYDLIWAQKIER